MEFKEFAKIGRLNREVIVSEKIDGLEVFYRESPSPPDAPVTR